MRKIAIIIILMLFSSCGIHNPNILNNTQIVTTVNLSGNNYRIIDKISARATATYILGIGGLKNKALLERAKAGLYEKANLTGSARAITYITYDTHYSLIYPVYYRVTITASGYVIDFK